MLLSLKYVDTRWVVWRTCVDLWVDHFDVFGTFLEAELKQYKKDKEPANLTTVLGLLKKSPSSTRAIMVFMIEETSMLYTTINVSQERERLHQFWVIV